MPYKTYNLLTNKQKDRQQYPFIDILKYICALLVVAIHAPPLESYLEQSELAKYLNFGIQNYITRIAVPFYFAAAGFFLFRKIDFVDFDTSILQRYIAKLIRFLGIWTILLFVGGTGHLWYISGLVIAVCVLYVLLYKKISLRNLVFIAILLYIFGLLGGPYYGLIRPLLEHNITGYPIKAYFILFDTTRNGLFMGFPFLILGGLIEKKRFTIKPALAFAGFLFSMVLLFGEAVLIKRVNLSKDINMYLFIPFAVFFLIVFSINVKIPSNKIYINLRKIGVIVYFSHLFVYQFLVWGWRAAEKLFGIHIDNSLLNCFLTIVVSSALGLIIVELSKNEKMSFLKYLYQ